MALIFSLMINNFYSINGNADEFKMKWKEVKELSWNSVLFKIDIGSSIAIDHPSYDEFVIGDELNYISFQLLDVPENVSIESVTVTFEPPSKKTDRHHTCTFYYYNDWKKIQKWPQSMLFTLNESGPWYVDIYFDSNKTIWPWEYIGYVYPWDDIDDYNVRTFSGTWSSFRKAVLVYTTLEHAQLRAAKAAEDTADKYEKSLWILGFSAGAAMGAAIATAIGVFLNWKLRKEILKNLKRR